VAIWKNIGEKGLQSLYYQNVRFHELLYKMYALAFVPVSDVVVFYEEQIVADVERGLDADPDWNEMKSQLETFGKYFCSVWIGSMGNTKSGIRRRPLFPLEAWNMYEAILNDGVSTNNCLESFNRTLNSLVGIHTNVWKIIDTFKKQEAETRRVLLSNAAGRDMHGNTGRKESTRARHASLKLIVQQYGTIPDEAYLQQLAHELQRRS
jgi:hypothetical protein